MEQCKEWQGTWVENEMTGKTDIQKKQKEQTKHGMYIHTKRGDL